MLTVIGFLVATVGWASSIGKSTIIIRTVFIDNVDVTLHVKVDLGDTASYRPLMVSEWAYNFTVRTCNILRIQ